ncbi:hypothetical protein ACIRBY_13280 [Streptomyces sp. NPDC096136]|uniref:hypothetical protein n=1 Tax=Streptomyces sp. NPDC096136 TaxID=3366076 RepID=UPI0038289F79
MTTGARSCPGDPGRASYGYDAVPLGAVGQRLLGEDAECRAAGTYCAKVPRTAAGQDSPREAWPVVSGRAEGAGARGKAVGGVGGAGGCGVPVGGPMWPGAAPCWGRAG